MIVVDASVLADALIDDGPAGTAARSALSDDLHWVGPGHLVVEVLSVIRGRLLGGKLAAGRAEDAVGALADLVIDQIDSQPHIQRIWELRGNLTSYDAAYAAAAEALGCPLLTSDRRLAQADAVACQIRLLGSSR